ncbi:hypothetical protein WJ33_15125 [Burkholderia ubonensis]|uniref:Uncharacterized protein n=1 Tax=Burkholderia ubonensis TaxID=101571 RepID=A0A103RW66_9BURK|nr:hypothetical protein WJ33_15125 [Burkholderia ubonensis]
MPARGARDRAAAGTGRRGAVTNAHNRAQFGKISSDQFAYHGRPIRFILAASQRMPAPIRPAVPVFDHLSARSAARVADARFIFAVPS